MDTLSGRLLGKLPQFCQKIFAKGQNYLNQSTHTCPGALTSVWRYIVCQRRSRKNNDVWGMNVGDGNPFAHSRLGTCAALLGTVYFWFSCDVLLLVRFRRHGQLRARPSAIHSSACRATSRVSRRMACLALKSLHVMVNYHTP